MIFRFGDPNRGQKNWSDVEIDAFSLSPLRSFEKETLESIFKSQSDINYINIRQL